MAIFQRCNKTKKKADRMFKTYVLSLLVLAISPLLRAEMADFVSVPPLLSSTEDALVMLVMSNDNQLWHKAYADYSDLDNDGDIDTTYNDQFVYLGYFDSEFCYSYSSGRYEPNGKVVRPQSETTEESPAPDHKCSGAPGNWSGNFMNWLTMTRIDIIRKVLYGGYRLTDTTSETVLQRALLPDDNHSFVKVVANDAIDGLISNYTPITGQSTVSFCNVTDPVDTSAGSRTNSINVGTNPPLIKVASGNFFTWSGSERNLCLYQDEGGDGRFTPQRPTHGSIGGIGNFEFYVRVSKCVSGQDQPHCRQYTDGLGNSYYKPYGLLQTYGEHGGLKFGLMTGSYEKNDAGGVLRKNISYMGGDDAVAEDREIDINTGRFINQGTSNEGIVNTLNRLRLSGWDYDSNFYTDCDTWGISIGDFLTSGAENRQCRDWGNPLTEMYLEALRYFSGYEEPSPEYGVDDSSIISGLKSVTWEKPLNSVNACANCAIILLSTGLNNFDGDDLASASDLLDIANADGIDTYTDIVGDSEGISSNNFMVGNASTGGTIDTCDAKTINQLSHADGICPEIPSLRGTYGLAGLSYYGFIKDMQGLTGEQNVNTYTVALAESLPNLELTADNDESLTIVPYCVSQHSRNVSRVETYLDRRGRERTRTVTDTEYYWQNCSLVDFNIVDSTEDKGVIYISWEDSLVGSDNDMDAYVVLEYCKKTGSADQVKTACGNYTTDERSGYARPEWGSASTGQIQFRQSGVGAATGVEMHFGYVVSGSDSDGTIGDLIFSSSMDDVFNSPALTGTDTNSTIWASDVHKFVAQSSTSGLLKNPLWYAAKYGNFKDSNDNNLPDLVNEWDKKDLDGNAGSDGIPDAYFPIRNPAYLESSLSRILSDITTRVSSGTAASVVASTGAGEGAVYQALYNPIFEVDSAVGNTEVNWVGTLHALFIDRYSQLREDVVLTGEAVGELNSNDPIIEIYYDETLGKTMVQRYAVEADGTAGAASGDPYGISELDPIWSARDQLARLSNYTDNRIYSESATNGRYIFTGIDNPDDRDGFISRSEGVAFIADTFDPSSDENFRLLDVGGDVADVSNLVNYIRGDETISTFRSRSIEYDGDASNGDDPWLLGDIVNSSPVVLTQPAKAYEISYGDETYRSYKKAKSNRRQVVHVGANDGMLHAFNAGFYDRSNNGYKASLSGETAHPLGSELWAYVPYNLLPHLQYLTSNDYSHVYYMDGQQQIFDVNGIWDGGSSIEHPSGWGSILVAGMRFGGGEISIDPDSDGDNTDAVQLRSGFVVLDVTDPESPPDIIAEITDEDLGYSVSVPTLVKFRSKNTSSGSYSSPAVNEWFLVFGSGPAGSSSNARSEALKNGVSDKTAKLYAYNLRTGTLQKFDTGISNAFIGGVEAGDWDNNFSDDAVYFGIVGGTEAAPTGQLMRATVTLSGHALSVSMSSVLDVNDKAFSAQPSIVRDRSNNFWVYSGTGRFLTSGDNTSNTVQTYYGVKDPNASTGSDTEVGTSSMVNTSDIEVYSDGRLKRGARPFTLNTGEEVANFSELSAAVEAHSGWFFDLPYTRERNTTKAVLSGESLVFTSYQPTGELCNVEGSGFLYAPHFQVGVPGEFGPLGHDDSITLTGDSEGDDEGDSDDSSLVNNSSPLGTGNPSTPTIFQDYKGVSHAIVQTSTGAINSSSIGDRERTGHRQTWREIPIDW